MDKNCFLGLISPGWAAWAMVTEVERPKTSSPEDVYKNLYSASVFVPFQSLVEDVEPLNFEQDTINAQAFLINDVRHWNRDKLTLLAAVQRVCQCICV